MSDDDNIEAYLKAHLDDFNYRAIVDGHIVEKVCLWQMLVLWNEGGVYIDMDRAHSTPLREIIHPDSRLVLPHIGKYMWTQDAMITAAGNPLLAITNMLQ